MLEGKKARYFLFYRRPNKKAFLGFRFVLQPENSGCVPGALDWKRDYLLGWETQGECPEEGSFDSAALLPDQSS